MPLKDFGGEVRLIDNGGIGVECDQPPVPVARAHQESEPVTLELCQAACPTVPRRTEDTGGAGLYTFALIPTRGPHPHVQMYSEPIARLWARWMARAMAYLIRIITVSSLSLWHGSVRDNLTSARDFLTACRPLLESFRAGAAHYGASVCPRG